MRWLSEESLLLVENWDTVADILAAEKRLRSELAVLLRSIESELAEQEWWPEGWAIVRNQDTQLTISHKNWAVDGDYVVWIGVETFSPENLFGMESPPTLYVWVSGREHALAQRLAQEIEKREDDVLGELDFRSSGYVVRHALRKCLPEEAETCDQMVRRQILGFLAHYAGVVWQLDEVIREQSSRL